MQIKIDKVLCYIVWLLVDYVDVIFIKLYFSLFLYMIFLFLGLIKK
jgi:hypothetical protein